MVRATAQGNRDFRGKDRERKHERDGQDYSRIIGPRRQARVHKSVGTGGEKRKKDWGRGSKAGEDGGKKSVTAAALRGKQDKRCIKVI